MGSRLKNMTTGRPAPLILTFALPLMVGNMFQQLYTVVDAMVVGRFLGVSALAALGAADWLNWMMLGITQGFAQGFAIPMAQEFGAGRHDRLRQAVGAAAILAACLALALVGLGQAAVDPILRLLQTPDDIIGGSRLYLRIMYSGIPLVMSFNLLSGVLRSLGDSKTPLRAMITASVTNISLDLLFVTVFRWGIAGAAAATLIAQGVSGLFCLRHILKVDILRLTKDDFRLRISRCAHLMALGAPMAFQNCIISVGGMILQGVINGFGVLFIAGYTATNKLFGTLELAAISYGYAMITYVGQNLGAGKTRRIRQGVRAALLIALATSALVAAVMLLFGRTIVGGFISGTPDEVEQAVSIAYHYLAVMACCLPVLYLLHVVRSTLQGMGNTVLPMVSGIMEFCMRTGVALLLSRIIGGAGVFYAEVSAWLGADIVLVTSYLVAMKRLTPDALEPYRPDVIRLSKR